ncbi:hypothetical protein AK830_g9714 [Neonectria ditissima]|uniref:Uncharacterized protein n=1 Tax=Neonectria ditissima TaxID=78410 RepID=A0A0P7AHF2_9HYPO|nr:hypothetical protein AK830_g9714 [Neonectria ditissima]
MMVLVLVVGRYSIVVILDSRWGVSWCARNSWHVQIGRAFKESQLYIASQQSQHLSSPNTSTAPTPQSPELCCLPAPGPLQHLYSPNLLNHLHRDLSFSSQSRRSPDPSAVYDTYLILDCMLGRSIDAQSLATDTQERREHLHSQLVDMLAEMRGLEFSSAGSLMPDPHGGPEPVIAPCPPYKPTKCRAADTAGVGVPMQSMELGGCTAGGRVPPHAVRAPGADCYS